MATSGLLAFALKKLLIRSGNWLPICLTVILPPLVFVPYGLFGLLRDIGKAAEATGQAPAHMIDNFSADLEALLAEGAIWLSVALPISILVTRWVQRRAMT